jgi:hypothetical protein
LGGLALVAALGLWVLMAGVAAAAALSVRATDKLDVGAPAVTTFPVGTSSVVAAVSYSGLAPGATIDYALVDAGGTKVVTYSEPAATGGSGEALARLIAPAALPEGSYRLQVSAGGATGESPITIGTPSTPPTLPTPAATAAAPGGPVPAPSSTPPVQLAPVRTNGLLAARAGVATEPSVGAVPNDPRFGLANVLPDGVGVPGQARSATVAWMTRARDAGAGGNRWELRWDRIEPRPGEYDWSEPDRIVAANQAAGLPLLAILIGTPVWAGGGQASAVPGGLDTVPILPDGSVGQANVWGRFVHELAQRYRGRINAYEIWNEPNRPDFWGGTPEQYYRLLSTGMAAIRHADPNARVVLGGLDGYRNLEFLDRLLNAAAADPAPPGRKGGFDVLAWHAYHRPLDVYTGTVALRERLRARGLTQPIWVTESNVAAWDDRPVRGADPQPYRWSARGDEQAAFVLEALAYAVAADVERIYLYRASDTGEAEAWGLLTADGTPRATEAAFRFVTSALAGTVRARRIRGEEIERIEVERPGQRVTLAWATGPRDAALIVPSATGRAATLRDKWGGIGTVEPTDGRYVLSLPGASADQGAFAGDWFIGGDPYVIVESVP